jgi:chromosome segregation ATPase
MTSIAELRKELGAAQSVVSQLQEGLTKAQNPQEQSTLASKLQEVRSQASILEWRINTLQVEIKRQRDWLASRQSERLRAQADYEALAKKGRPEADALQRYLGVVDDHIASASAKLKEMGADAEPDARNTRWWRGELARA